MQLKKPLPAAQDRCLGHWEGKKPWDWCPQRDNCARHMTIHHPNEPWVDVRPPLFRMCVDDKFVGRIEPITWGKES